MSANIREIPYNYTSFSDREIVTRLLGEKAWLLLNKLRSQRRTGRSARMLFAMLGDMWVIKRNPYIQDDLFSNPRRRDEFYNSLTVKLEQIQQRADDNQDALALIKNAKTATEEFKNWLIDQQRMRKVLLKRMIKHTHRKNILFDGMSRVSHVTDASDWRVEYPCVVLTPETEKETVKLVRECLKLDINIIPRGGGTGYTGGAVPLTDKSVVINTEKLDLVHAVKAECLPGLKTKTNVIEAGAGAITSTVRDAAAKANLIFAVDPTSQDSSTIGGNIAMNAGGKKALRWGTTLDNLASWKMVLPDGKLYQIKRLAHNLGKIHHVPEAKFIVEPVDSQGKSSGEGKTISLKAEDVRKPGIGKDVTNKLLGKLPGLQKEGCDGIITSARFILHPKPKHTQTLCLEFFDPDMHKSVPAIIEIIRLADKNPKVNLIGLEHLDNRYIKAVGYSTKSSRSELPHMLLLADISGESESGVKTVIDKIIAFGKKIDAIGFVATNPEARAAFWADRKKTAAIAAHTNAFKVNEDVVIPLARLAEYADEIERINVEQSISNKLEIIKAYQNLIKAEFGNCQEDDELASIRQDKLNQALNRLALTYAKWQGLLADLDRASDGGTVFRLLQQKKLTISLRDEVQTAIDDILNGNEWVELRKSLLKQHAKIRNRRIFVATHMHAGDGNVHTNIPVHSNDYKMLKEVDKIVDRIMLKTKELGGAVSGEHGIGLTKIKYLSQENINNFQRYKQEIDKNANFNRGKLSADNDLANAYTPSFRLLELEAILLEASELGLLNAAIKDCLRCGKCKPHCSTHAPRVGLLYSPRNKILASGLLIEAFLYEEQTRRGIALSHFSELNDISDHCAVCHRCLEPCPVNIDYGDVTMLIRHILKKQGKRKFNPGNFFSMLFLTVNDARLINFLRKIMIKFSYAAQRQLSKFFSLKKTLPHTTGGTTGRQQIVSFMQYPMPGGLPKKPLRGLLPVAVKDNIPIIRNHKTCDESAETVFYFPGCGSERLYSDIGLGVLAWLYHLNVQTVIPPGYLCCGYPQIASGDRNRGKKIITDNMVLLHRMAKALGFIKISKVIVSCGTCLAQLLEYELDKLFPQAELLDIHEFLLEKNVQVDTSRNNYLLHDPCHSPDKKHNPVNMAARLLNAKVELTDRCCGEAGTLALTRPDISTQVKFRKLEELGNNIKNLATDKVLTTCPSCLQGLARLEPDSKLAADYIILEMTQKRFGADWQDAFINKIKPEDVESVLF